MSKNNKKDTEQCTLHGAIASTFNAKKRKEKRKKPINKQLKEKFGGYWKYIPFQSLWVCDELNVHACYVAEGGYDIDGNYQPVPSIFRRLTVYGLKDGVTHLYPV